MTADGKIDTFERRGARISGPADSARVDRLRAESDAVLVGGHTLLGEDPRLTVRDPNLSQVRVRSGRPAQPTRIGVVSVIDVPGESNSLPRESRFLGDNSGRVIICTTRRTDATAIAWLESRGARVEVHDGRRVDLKAALSVLADTGVERLLVEGGSTIVAALLEAQLVDEVQLAVAPMLFGGETAPTPVGGSGWTAGDAVRLSLTDLSRDDDGGAVLRYVVAGHATA